MTVKGVIANVYGPNIFPQKLDFLATLDEEVREIGDQHWIMMMEFNIITYLEDKKGGKRILVVTNEAFKGFINDNQLLDVKIGNGWFT